MRWAYWLILGGISLLLHLAVFWPTPGPVAVSTFTQSIFSVRINSDPEKPVGVTSTPPADEKPSSHLRRDKLSKSDHQSEKLRAIVPPKLIEQKVGLNRTSRTTNSLPAENSAASLSPEAAFHEQADAITSPLKGGSLIRYRIALAAAALRQQACVQSPESLSGTAVIEIRLTGLQDLPLLALGRSSGVERLDAEALSLLGRAVRDVPVATAGALAEARITLPIVFGPGAE